MNTREHIAFAALTRAVTMGIEHGHIDPVGPDFRGGEPPAATFFTMKIGGRIPARVCVRPWRDNECLIRVSLFPAAEVDRWLPANGAGSLAGEAVVSAYLSRWGELQLCWPSNSSIYIAKARQAELAALPAPSRENDPFTLYPGSSSNVLAA